MFLRNLKIDHRHNKRPYSRRHNDPFQFR